ncbi:putative protein kinase [Hamiltosporidium tvaerminnensis]|uniref:Protein kinase domain-containing protein n=1 Tax=Hamiltosporidium tvaerminnensis TaxID=1176355 RepID=A0A4Q9LVI1_9MICR|nr:putative protein kinase [Hamiltosporidium tvaerminnensis]
MNHFYFIFLLYKIFTTTRNYSVGFIYEISQNRDFFVKKPINEYSKKYLLNEKCVYETLNHPYILGMRSSNFEMNEVSELQFEIYDFDLKVGIDCKCFNDFEKIAILRMLLDVVNYLHANKLVHNNLVLENILIKGKQLKLSNFAFSAFTDQTKERIYENLDTIGFYHNEIVFNSKPEISDDIRNLGCIIEELFQLSTYTYEEIEKSFTLKEARKLVNKMKNYDLSEMISVEMALKSKIFRFHYGFIRCFCGFPDKKIITHTGIYEKCGNSLSKIFLNKRIDIKCDCICSSSAENKTQKSNTILKQLMSGLSRGCRCCRAEPKNIVVTINGISNCLLDLIYDDLSIVEETYNKFFLLY